MHSRSAPPLPKLSGVERAFTFESVGVGMSLPIYYYVLGTPLGLLGLIRWGCWLVRRIPAALYRPVWTSAIHGPSWRG